MEDKYENMGERDRDDAMGRDAMAKAKESKPKEIVKEKGKKK